MGVLVLSAIVAPLMESLYGWSFQPKGSRSKDCVGHPREADNGEIITTGILSYQQ